MNIIEKLFGRKTKVVIEVQTNDMKLMATYVEFAKKIEKEHSCNCTLLLTTAR